MKSIFIVFVVIFLSLQNHFTEAKSFKFLNSPAVLVTSSHIISSSHSKGDPKPSRSHAGDSLLKDNRIVKLHIVKKFREHPHAKRKPGTEIGGLVTGQVGFGGFYSSFSSSIDLIVSSSIKRFKKNPVKRV